MGLAPGFPVLPLPNTVLLSSRAWSVELSEPGTWHKRKTQVEQRYLLKPAQTRNHRLPVTSIDDGCQRSDRLELRTQSCIT